MDRAVTNASGRAGRDDIDDTSYPALGVHGANGLGTRELGSDKSDKSEFTPGSPSKAFEPISAQTTGLADIDHGEASSGRNRRKGDRRKAQTGIASFLPAAGPVDKASLIGAVLGGALFLGLALISLNLSSFDSMPATVWLPSAGAVAFLLRARLSNEVVFYAFAFISSVVANLHNDSSLTTSVIFSLANVANVAVVTGLTRRLCGENLDMTDLGTLARLVFVGGMIGPLVSVIIAAPTLPVVEGSIAMAATAWFMTDSMGMTLIVPVVLLVSDALSGKLGPARAGPLETAALLLLSIASSLLVLGQNAYPLLFLIPPVTLLQAFRLGSLGTALHVTLVAATATLMTWSGHGPIYEMGASPAARLHVIQAFIATNFLIGLPVSAILAGRQRLSDAVIMGQKELSLLADNITDAVFTLDAKGVCTYASPSVRDVLGRDPAELVGQPITKRVHEESNDPIRETLAKLLSGQSDKERLTYRRLLDDGDGVPVFIEADCAVVANPFTQQRDGVIISARNVTERVELELLLTRARKRAEHAANAKSDFLANMSHEIRTPMNGVLGFAELMLQGDLNEKQRRHTEMIVESGRSMMLLLNDILDLSKIEAGQIIIDKRPINVAETLEECVALHRASAATKAIKLELVDTSGSRSTGEGKAQGVLTDGLRLRQIILNLLSNAVKFTERGAITLSYELRKDALTLKVRDTGIGIAEERLEKIFNPFTQAQSDTTRRFGGTGLGLSISRQLAGLLGGELSVESTPGSGSTFTLFLPTTLVTTKRPAAPLPQPKTPPTLPQNARILLAEDHDVNRALATEMLERCGQCVEIAADGNEAIAMVLDSVLRGPAFDLVLMDIQMPRCDGYSATRAIRNEGIGGNELPIIALTANAFPEDIRTARAAGMQGHLAKPIRFANLARALQRWLPTRIVEAPMDRDVPDHPLNQPDLPFNSDKPANAHQPALVARWLARRSETIETLRKALQDGILGADCDVAYEDAASRRLEVKQQMHKLAGTAGTFGEAELGDQAALLEQALQTAESGKREVDCEALAFELLALADEPAALEAQRPAPSV